MKLSIIVTTYNIENYIAKCLESICAQTIEDIEIIVVDDASNDNTVSIIKEFEVKDSRIKSIVFEKNTIGGVSSAANAGLDIAQGEYIGFADGDDWYETDMFERLYNKAKAADAEVAFCNYLEFDEQNNVNKTPSDHRKWKDIVSFDHDKVSDEKFKKLFLRFNPVPWRKVYKRDFIEKNNVRFPVGDYFFEDNPFHWETTVKAKVFAFDSYVGCYHRINRPGQTMGTADARLIAMYDHHSTIISMLNASDTFEQYKNQCIGWLIGNTSWISEKITPECHEALFNALSAELNKYQPEFIQAISGTPVVGIRGTDLIKSVQEKNFEQFCKVAKRDVNSKLPAKQHDNIIMHLASQAYNVYKQEGLKAALAKVKLFVSYKLNLKKRNSVHVTNRQLLKEIKDMNSTVNKLHSEVRVLKAAMALLQHEKKQSDRG
ncbi:glycosyltransferase [Photobacterium sp. ZSDE20]|uniref:Glycosyltransferase n=1 Tax=Photobacterium pectinilyticum TaxID=2906793 RepID=A0ABT1N0T6_9GAMM|nr:glycosyltransferase family 2 protein [Photobacterium sp. ZSDE20]MCQ1058342.1 glycosyltransferase [Photobacterium sp. ZSDE20]MDD1823137.1 glycosyltransferase [Photobacterium sp. ZSDE20]